jgi:hypothetical protein
MSLRRVLIFLLIQAAALLAQISNNTVTVTASLSSTAQPDEAVFSVVVSSGTDKSLDDVVSAISGLGITAANLVTVNTAGASVFNTIGAPPPPGLLGPQWIFQLVVPFSKLKDTTAALTALQKSISQNNSGLTLSFTLSGTQVSGQQAPSCNLADLVAKARSHAQDIAGAAGFKAGAIVGLTSATSTAPLLGCSLTVRFALGMMFGQPEPNITITATRTNNIQPDQVLIGLSVQSPTTAGLDDILGALTGSGVSGANFTGVYTTTSYSISGGVQTAHTALVWSFTLTAPLAKLSATLTQIRSAQQSISANNPGLTLTFYLEGTRVSPQLQQSQPCSQAALLSDAQSWARQVATAAGVSAGPILSIGSVASAALQLVGGGSYPFQIGINTISGAGSTWFPTPAVSIPTPVYTAPQTTCSLTVEFQLM